MNDKKKAKGTHNEFPLRDDMCMTDTVSSTDCTGMVPTGSVDSAEEFDNDNKTHRFSKAKGKK